MTIENSAISRISAPNWYPTTTNVALTRVKAEEMRISMANLAMCDSEVSGATDLGGYTLGKQPPIVLGEPSAGCGGNELGALTVSNQSVPMSMNSNVVRGLAKEDWGTVPLTLAGTGNRFLGGTTGAFTEFAQRQGNSTQSLAAAKTLSGTQSLNLSAGKAKSKAAKESGRETLAQVWKASALAKKELKAREKEARQAAQRAGKVKVR